MRRSGIKIMGKLMGLAWPLFPVILLAIAAGVLGFLCAIFLTVLGARGILPMLDSSPGGFPGYLLWLLPLLALLRGVLHYIEQYSNHYIAFKLLEIIRSRVFDALRRLAPAKLEGKNRGDLIALITSDTELLEVFYAHTISPVAIAFFVCLMMVLYIGSFSPLCALLAAAGYLWVGLCLPVINSRRNKAIGMAYRSTFGELNGFVLDSLRGLLEILQFGLGKQRLADLETGCDALSQKQKGLREIEGSNSAFTGLSIMAFSFAMLFLSLYLYQRSVLDFAGLVTVTVAMMSSFGPVSLLASLSDNLSQTLASGERVLRLLEEKESIEEVTQGEETAFTGASLIETDFSYEKESPVLSGLNLEISKGSITGIYGKSGCGKSTVLKLLMRFWDVDRGRVEISGKDIRRINTSCLRNLESFVTQETLLFHDTIAANIAIAKPEADQEEIMEAARKASIHDFIMDLPKGYATQVSELGESLSGGEKQRIGLARAFLHQSDLMLLDEPTSNLDSLNEGMILKSLKEESRGKTVLLVSHRNSTLGICQEVVKMPERAS